MQAIQIDGSYGEGGGQILRTSLTLSVLTGRPLELVNIRAGRSKPGLRPQHLTAVRAAAAICSAELSGDALHSQYLSFRPMVAPLAGEYRFDVSDAAPGGSAGSTTLIAQTVLLPLALAGQVSQVTLCGGTHVAWSPPFHYLQQAFLPALQRMGLRVDAQLETWGWYPVGRGELKLVVQPGNGLDSLVWDEPGELERVTGVAAVTNLPAHIPQRMASRANKVLQSQGISAQVQPLRARGPAAGAGVFLTAEYSKGVLGFSALGRRGKPSEQVADEACDHLLQHHRTGRAVDPHLADQLVLPLALAAGESTFSASKITPHTLSNMHVVQRFLDAPITVDRMAAGGLITIKGIAYHV